MADSLWNLRGAIKNVKPNCPAASADQFINRRIRNVIDKRSWSDSLRLGTIAIPDAYTTGTIALTPGSNQIIGTGTNWPTNDLVNTALVTPIVENGYVEDIQPASMQNIAVGMFLVIEVENPDNTEIVPVNFAGPAKFTAYIRKRHDAGISVIASSLQGLQLRTNNYVWTVQGVVDPTQLQVDQKWAGMAQSGQAYQIVLEYAQITSVTKRALYCWDPVQGSPVDTASTTMERLNADDPQRQSTGDPQALVMMPPNAAGVMQFEIWPTQFTARLLNVVTSERWPLLKYDTDLSPWFLNPEIFIAGACADALRTRVIPSYGKQDPYYDPDTANGYWEPEYARILEEAEQNDQGRYMRALQNYEEQAMQMVANYNYLRSHPTATLDWGWI